MPESLQEVSTDHRGCGLGGMLSWSPWAGREHLEGPGREQEGRIYLLSSLLTMLDLVAEGTPGLLLPHSSQELQGVAAKYARLSWDQWKQKAGFPFMCLLHSQQGTAWLKTTAIAGPPPFCAQRHKLQYWHPGHWEWVGVQPTPKGPVASAAYPFSKS